MSYIGSICERFLPEYTDAKGEDQTLTCYPETRARYFLQYFADRGYNIEAGDFCNAIESLVAWIGNDGAYEGDPLSVRAAKDLMSQFSYHDLFFMINTILKDKPRFRSEVDTVIAKINKIKNRKEEGAVGRWMAGKWQKQQDRYDDDIAANPYPDKSFQGGLYKAGATARLTGKKLGTAGLALVGGTANTAAQGLAGVAKGVFTGKPAAFKDSSGRETIAKGSGQVVGKVIKAPLVVASEPLRMLSASYRSDKDVKKANKEGEKHFGHSGMYNNYNPPGSTAYKTFGKTARQRAAKDKALLKDLRQISGFDPGSGKYLDPQGNPLSNAAMQRLYKKLDRS